MLTRVVDAIEETNSKALPTVTGFAFDCALAALRRRNLDPGPLLHRVGLSDADFGGRPRRVAASSQGEFLEAAAEAVGDTAFGLHLAEQSNPREVGLLFYVATAAHNLGEALGLFARYFRIVNESVRFTLVPDTDGLIVSFNLIGVSQNCVKQNTEFWLALIMKAARDVTGCAVRPTRVVCPHMRNQDLQEFERFFGCAVEFGASSGQLAFSSATLALPLMTEDAHLLDVLRPFCEEAEKARNTLAASFRAVVENEVERLLPHAQADAKTVANSLGLSVATLSRRLSREETTFVEVVDQLRRSLALQYLKEPGFTLAQIAWLLGYERPTSFKHAFKRWTGRPPSAMRGENTPPTPK